MKISERLKFKKNPWQTARFGFEVLPLEYVTPISAQFTTVRDQ